MTKDELRTALESATPADLAYLVMHAGVTLRTLHRIRAGDRKASPLTIKAVAPVLARLARKGTK